MTFAPSYDSQATTAAGEVAAHAEERKILKYRGLPVTHSFVQVAIETTGVIGVRSLQFLKELGRRVHRQTGDPNSTSYLLQRLSIDIQRGNSASVMGVAGVVFKPFPPQLPLFFIFYFYYLISFFYYYYYYCYCCCCCY